MPTTTRDGVRLYYERHGDGGDPILMIMGLGSPLEFWEFQTPVLSRAHRVCIYDNRGIGKSDKPAGPYDVGSLADDAVAVMDACGFQRAHVIGFSMGGMIAQELAIRHSDRVGALVLAATYAKPDEDTRRAMSGPAIDPKTIEPKQLFKMMMGMILTPEFVARERDWLRATRDRVLANVSIEGFFAQLAAASAHDASARLERIHAPTLVLKPAADMLIPPRASDELARLIPGAALTTFEHASHGFNVEQADKFNRAVLDFFARHALDDEARF
ncbi:MAG TPA: alpha/beta fold hydrolase [Polyangia bacterium]|nr:alpha/beta fold hydrolase [Polyangia bacterium]